mmetsp:Transcript_22621/g.41241  ORF Transcript_22621/g.41241 Transcript_22621/m.41241 type:complete len:138 (-) Transcript_22621:155-568(-)
MLTIVGVSLSVLHALEIVTLPGACSAIPHCLHKALGRRERLAQSRMVRDTLATGVEADSKECCPICLNDFVMGELLGALPCGHRLHSDCIQQWVFTKHSSVSTCPMRCPNVTGNVSTYKGLLPADVTNPIAPGFTIW